MPANPIEAMASAIHTWGRANACSSLRGSLRTSSCGCGTKRQTRAMVHRAISPTNTNAERQPKYCPRKVATGLPSSMANVRPIITRATAPARWLFATMLDATTAAMPK
ncbi:hypothetical protein D3C79_810640 [compost metagenome]